jgi:hypothetical protein
MNDLIERADAEMYVEKKRSRRKTSDTTLVAL